MSDAERPSCVLNQTNIKNNANKFYNIQLVAADMGEQYWVFTKWGRVGKKGQNQTQRYTVAAQAKRDFEKKFYEKTRNMWAERAAFTPVKDNYTLIEIDYGDEVPVQTEKKTRKGKADSDDKVTPRPRGLPLTVPATARVLAGRARAGAGEAHLQREHHAGTPSPRASPRCELLRRPW